MRPTLLQTATCLTVACAAASIPRPASGEPAATQPTLAAPAEGALAHAMFVPMRADDFAWENDKVAFRVYGLALQRREGPQSGIDFWVKRTPRLVQRDWYLNGDYHRDRGEGLDGYQVGTSRGCGGTAVVRDDRLYLGSNFVAYEILENGPRRVVFTLDYAPQDCGGLRVTERKRVTLEAGSHFSRIESTFTFDGPPIEVAVGLKVHPKGRVLQPDDAARFIACWEPVDGKDNGDCGTAVLLPGDAARRVVQRDGQLLLVTSVSSGKPLVYFAGGGWSKAGFKTADEWLTHVRETAFRLHTAVR